MSGVWEFCKSLDRVSVLCWGISIFYGDGWQENCPPGHEGIYFALNTNFSKTPDLCKAINLKFKKHI